MTVTNQMRITQFEIIRNYIIEDIERLSKHLNNNPDLKLELLLISKRGKLYNQLMRVDNSLKREYKELKKEEEKPQVKEKLTKENLVLLTEHIDNLIAEEKAKLPMKYIPNPPRRPAHIRNW